MLRLFSSGLRYIAHYLMWQRVRQIKGLVLGREVVILGKPLIDIRDGGEIHVGDRVTLNSRNHGYHLNMHSPVKLFADRPGARISIGSETRIHGACLHAYMSISVGKNCLIAANCQIMDSNGHALSFDDVDGRLNTKGESRPIVIGDAVWIGANSIILPGVSIGRGAIIGAGSVVTRDVPERVVAAGNPARVVRRV